MSVSVSVSRVFTPFFLSPHHPIAPSPHLFSPLYALITESGSIVEVLQVGMIVAMVYGTTVRKNRVPT